MERGSVSSSPRVGRQTLIDRDGVRVSLDLQVVRVTKRRTVVRRNESGPPRPSCEFRGGCLLLVPDGYKAYRQAAVETAAPEKLVLMLYDGAIRFIGQARGALDNGNLAEVNRLLLKAQDIVMELMVSLDRSAGKIADNLFLVYDYIYWRLVQANVEKDHAKMEEAKSMLAELREAWAQALRLEA